MQLYIIIKKGYSTIKWKKVREEWLSLINHIFYKVLSIQVWSIKLLLHTKTKELCGNKSSQYFLQRNISESHGIANFGRYIK